MKSIYGAFALVSLLGLPGTVTAGQTSISQLPILNLDDTGAVKPNLMLLYDNSGSMASDYTPDFIADNTSCRSRFSMAAGMRSCVAGHPPYASPDFNRQYYDPRVRYLPAVKYDGTSYDSLTSGNSSKWTKVPIDAFNINTKDLVGATVSTTNLVSGFPDVRWCDTNNNNCAENSATYSYPNNTLYTAQSFTANPYYYMIQVAEYCTDDNLRTCTTTTVGAAAPAGFPIPARIRYCDTSALTNCQAKYSDTFKYPRFSNPNGGATAAYGTITIGASSGNGAIAINSVSVVEAGGAVVITNGIVAASGGTNTVANQVKLAEDVAASILAKTGLARTYTACVYKPSKNSIVPACGIYGITLPTSNTSLAVVPLVCDAGSTGKASDVCAVLSDSSRNGWALTVNAPIAVVTAEKAAMATLSVSGTSAKVAGSTVASKLPSLTLNGVSLINPLTFASNVNSATVATAIANAISATGVSAVTGCGNYITSVVCISTTASSAANQKLVAGTITSPGSLQITVTNTTAGNAAVTDMVPTTTVPIGAGAAIFVRTDIVSTNNSYPKAATRLDCAGATCTYDEEMTNFANWYSFYRTRNQMMKTSVGLAFQAITANFNVGVVSLSVAAAGGAMTPPLPFSGTNRSNWYTNLYAMNGNSTTPLRPALNSVGQMYANQGKYTAAVYKDVVKFPCQQNYTFMTTDGYWNGAAATGVAGNLDKVESAASFCLASTGCVDPTAQTAGSLADVALYWYNGGPDKSLRLTLEDAAAGAVPGKAGENTRLHMNTYTLGLGVDGIMNYEDNYDVQPAVGGDFYNLVHGVDTGCPWNNNGAYVWPNPKADDATASVAYQTRVDDLWHTAINGHGKYFSASNPTQVVTGLRSALSNIIAHSGAAAAAATSTPNISQNDNDLFSVSFTTVQWSGEVTDKKIDPITGAVGSEVVWSSSDTLGLKVSDTSDTRKILMLNTADGTFKNFTYTAMTSLEKGWFDNKCSTMAQCAALNAADRVIVNNGATVVNWLRGQQQYANDIMLRAYGKRAVAGVATSIPLVLGDIASSKPAYVREPRKAYLTAGYAEYVTAKKARKPAVYVGSNDGMLHAFETVNGQELWAYVPRITMKKLYAQAGTTYGTNHQYTVDGSPEVGDVQINGVWKSVLVAGLAGGGRGYYAVDVTDPDNPQPLWETCADATICTGVNNEPEIGMTFGNPLTGMWKDGSGNTKWVAFVTSGYNNVPNSDGVAGGTGKGWLMVLDIATGKVLAKTSTGSGDTTTPSGLARITGITADPNYDPKMTYIYGGDVLGQMWRFDLTGVGAPTVIKMGDAGSLQPITARPDVTYCEVIKTDANGLKTSSAALMVAFGTGRLLDVGDLTNVDKQSLYVLRDGATGIPAAQWRTGVMSHQQLSKNAANTVYSVSGTPADLSTQLGWYVDFDQNKGERVNLDVVVAQGAINVVTNTPDSTTSCKVGGSSALYALNVCTGLAGKDGQAGVVVPGGAATAGFGIVSTATGLVAEIKLVNGQDAPMQLSNPKDPVSRRSGWRRIRN